MSQKSNTFGNIRKNGNTSEYFKLYKYIIGYPLPISNNVYLTAIYNILNKKTHLKDKLYIY